MKCYYIYYSKAIINHHKEVAKKEDIELPYILERGDVANYYGNILGFEDYLGEEVSNKKWVELKRDLEDLLKLCPKYKFFMIEK